MGNIRTLQLNPQQRAELEDGYQNGKSHAFRKRCHLVLLKTQKRTSKEVGAIVGLHEVSVNNWLNRYEKEGINGLKTKPGRGRKPIIDPEKDAEKVRKAVEQERQRLSQAKHLLETELDKEFSLKTLKRFLKKTTVATNAFD
jgi:transposase